MNALDNSTLSKALDKWNSDAAEPPLAAWRYTSLSAVAHPESVVVGTLHLVEAVVVTSNVGCATTIETGSVAPKLAFGYSSRSEVEARVLAEPLIPTSSDAGRLDDGPQHVASVETSACRVCVGVGHVDCPKCDGRRKIDCTPCGATGRISDAVTHREPCTICGGRGDNVYPCKNCQRLGGFACNNCDVNGHVYTYGKKADGSTYAMSRAVCPICGSTKRILCPICNGDTVVRGGSCPKCHDGFVTVTSTHERDCGRCAGTSREECDECGGEGSRTCGTCRSSRTEHAVEYLWHESTSTKLGSWTEGVGSALLPSSHREALLQGGTRTTLALGPDGQPGENGLSALIREMKAAGSPMVDGIERLADREYEPNSVVVLWRRTVEATTFDAAAPSWFGQFALIGDELVAATDLVPPIDEERKSTDELRTSKRQAAYAAWRPGETARRVAESEAEVAAWEAGRAREIAKAARGQAAIRRAALVKVSVFAIWSLVALLGTASQSGVINQALTLLLLVGTPAYLLRHRIPTWIANCRFRPSPIDTDDLAGARPRPPGEPPEKAPPDWVEPTPKVA